jgi:hypothetical protein
LCRIASRVAGLSKQQVATFRESSLFKQTGTELKNDLKHEWEKLRGDDLEKVKEGCNNFMAATSVVGPAFHGVLMNKS